MDRDKNTDIFSAVAWVVERWIDAGHPKADDHLRQLARDLELTELDAANLRRAAKESQNLQGLVSEMGQQAGLLAVHATLMVGVADGRLDANERLWIHLLAQELGITVETVEQLERSIWADLAQVALEQSRGPVLDPAAAPADAWRWAKLAGGVIGGGALIAAGGWVAAPLIGGVLGWLGGLSGAAATSAGLAWMGGGSLAAGGFGMAGGQIAVAVAGGLGGAALGGSKTARRLAPVTELAVQPIVDGLSAHAVLGVPGFLTQGESSAQAWGGLARAWPHAESAGLLWESQALRELGSSLALMTGNAGAAGTLAHLALAATRRAWQVAALPALALQAVSLIDNPWDVAQNRAVASGAHLADAIMSGRLGRRPLTLVGFSLGTRVIVETAAALDKAGPAGRGWLSGVTLLGGATPTDHPGLDALARVVRGPIVNGYATNDWVLYGLFQAREWARPIGLGPLNLAKIVDVDLSQRVSGHLDYMPKVADLLAITRAASM